MPAIRVIPELLNAQSKLLATLGDFIRQSGGDISAVRQAAPSYDGQFKPKIDAIVAEANARSNQLSTRMLHLTDDLLRRAERFRLADVAASMSFYGGFFQTEASWQTTFFTRLKALIDSLNPIRWLGNLLHFDKTPVDTAVTNPPKSGFGELIDASKPAAEEKRSAFGELMERMKKEEELRLNGWPVPVLDQLRKEVKDAWGVNACTFTSLAMLMQYYNQVNPSNQFRSELELMEMRDPEDGKAKNPISISNLQDEIESLGYRYESQDGNHTIESLQEALKAGPVIALVHLHGAPHAVVVRGIDPDGNILINDPWGGAQLKMKPDEFKKIWGKIEPDGNYIIVIRPGQ